MCSKESKPVCQGSKMYKNFCDAFCHGCSADDLHDCNSRSSYHDRKFKTVQECCCPPYYQPVCGSDGKVYHNYCHLTCNGCTQSPHGAICGMGGLPGPGFGGFPRPGFGGVPLPGYPNGFGGPQFGNFNQGGAYFNQQIAYGGSIGGGFAPKNPNVYPNAGQAQYPKNPNV